MNDDDQTDWTEVGAKCLCFIALQQSEIKNGTMLERANFLGGLGLSRTDRASILGTSAHSLAELERQSRKRKGAKKREKKR